MKTFFLFVLIVALVWIVFNRQRIYVRDPNAKVYRNDVRQTGTEVYFNSSSDLLVQQDLSDAQPSRTILQSWDHMPGTPQNLACLRWIVCLTDSDHATVLPSVSGGKNAYDPQVKVNGRVIAFVDPAGVRIRVEV